MPPLREIRLRKLYTLRSLAAAAGVAQRTIVEAEAGRQLPRVATIRKLAATLEVDPMDVDEFREAIEAEIERGKDAA